MDKIQSINIQDFKFFAKSEPIAIEGKHLLLYGENGSGKSSIYWSLYTLLESSQKKDAEIQVYFDKSNPKNLVNLYAADNTHSKVSIRLTSGTVFQITAQDTSINTQKDAQDSSNASDFLTYRFLFNLHNFKQGEDINLFPLFLKDIFKYIKIGGRTDLASQFETLKTLDKRKSAYKSAKKEFNN
ncbi:MAG: hypothetical protein JJT94_04575, partial [Bernardetiaceae bacterium]|nr:hypothetical protein [Bernardetiaceae bacterium]